MVPRIHARGDIKALFAHTKVRTQIRGHLVEWLEERWEDVAPCANDRVARIGNVELRLARVEVERRLDAVADVVDRPTKTGASK